jgi:hypothetical protein
MTSLEVRLLILVPLLLTCATVVATAAPSPTKAGRIVRPVASQNYDRSRLATARRWLRVLNLPSPRVVRHGKKDVTYRQSTRGR